MERVTGIGGLFFRAKDPVALAHWYRDNLGIASGVDGDYVWEQEAGPTVFAPFPRDTEYFKNPDKQTMVNFRVRDLDAMIEQLRRAGADLDDEIQIEDYGRFGWATDPEGNRIELWEPATPT